MRVCICSFKRPHDTVFAVHMVYEPTVVILIELRKQGLGILSSSLQEVMYLADQNGISDASDKDGSISEMCYTLQFNLVGTSLKYRARNPARLLSDLGIARFVEHEHTTGPRQTVRPCLLVQSVRC